MKTKVRFKTRLLSINQNNVGIYRRYIKTPMDFSLSLCALIILSPLLLATAVIVRAKLGRPIIFKQERPGENGKIFVLYKFRTMTEGRDSNGQLLPDEIRLTRFGKFLRSTSIDEFPELINILKGEMSLVGPRPLLKQYLPLYNEEQKRRHEAKPGLTGLAQVNGRNGIGWGKRFEMDVDYVSNITFLGDWRIIFQTLKKVILREGINSETAVTMECFQGNEVGGSQ